MVKRELKPNIVKLIACEIINGTLPAGSLLPPDSEFMRRFGVSRTVLREAQKTLSAKGFILPKARVGTRILEQTSWSLFDPAILTWQLNCGISPAMSAHLRNVLMAFEPAAASLAADRRTKDDLSSLNAIIDRLATDNESHKFTIETHVEFHTAIMWMSRNPFFRSASAIIPTVITHESMRPRATTSTSTIIEIYRHISSAIERQNHDEAGAAVLSMLRGAPKAE